MNKWNQKKYEKYLDKKNYDAMHNEMPLKLDNYSLAKWFARNHEHVEDNELIIDTIHNRNCTKKFAFKPWLLRSNKKNLIVKNPSMHKIINPSRTRPVESYFGYYELPDDNLRNIQPTDRKYEHKTIRSRNH